MVDFETVKEWHDYYLEDHTLKETSEKFGISKSFALKNFKNHQLKVFSIKEGKERITNKYFPELKKLYEQGFSLKKCGEKLGINATLCKNILNRFGVNTNNRIRLLNDENKIKEVIESYRQTKSMKKTGDDFNVSADVVSSILKKNNIELETYDRKKIEDGADRSGRLYMIYHGIKKRCYNERDTSFYRYGARGIKMCNEWLESYKVFYDWAMTNGYQDDLSIDRIDFNGNYESNNCRWVNKKVQANNKSDNRYFLYKGERLNISQLSEKYNVPYYLLNTRLNKGWTLESAIQKPAQKQTKRIYNWKGKKLNVHQIAELEGLNYKSLHSMITRKNNKKSLEEAVERLKYLKQKEKWKRNKNENLHP